jgi:hypothetical protein
MLDQLGQPLDVDGVTAGRDRQALFDHPLLAADDHPNPGRVRSIDDNDRRRPGTYFVNDRPRHEPVARRVELITTVV